MENYLGESKYDGNIRRVTLIKKVADKLDMHDGDMLSYWEIGDEIVIRKVKQYEFKEAQQVYDYIPEGTPLEEAKMMVEASFDIAEYYVSSKEEPTGVQMIEIAEKASNHFPDTFSKEKRGEMLRISIELAKNIMSKTKVVNIPQQNETE